MAQDVCKACNGVGMRLHGGTDDVFVALVHALLRDHLANGHLEELVQQIEAEPPPYTFAVPPAADLARHYVRRLRAVQDRAEATLCATCNGAGDVPERCEGCGAPSTVTDAEGIPLCDGCASALSMGDDDCNAADAPPGETTP